MGPCPISSFLPPSIVSETVMSTIMLCLRNDVAMPNNSRMLCTLTAASTMRNGEMSFRKHIRVVVLEVGIDGPHCGGLTDVLLNWGNVRLLRLDDVGSTWVGSFWRCWKGCDSRFLRVAGWWCSLTVN